MSRVNITELTESEVITKDTTKFFRPVFAGTGLCLKGGCSFYIDKLVGQTDG